MLRNRHPVAETLETLHQAGTRRTISKAGWLLISRWFDVRRQRRALAELDGQHLDDIGLTRSQVASETAKPFWK